MPRGQRKLHRVDPATGVEQRECSTCTAWLLLSEFFLHGRFRSNICKPCERARARNRHADDRIKSRTEARAYALANPERVKARMASWREKNRERLTAYQNQYNANRAESMREYMRQKRASGAAREYQRDYARRNPTKGADKRALYRARMEQAPVVERIDRVSIIKRDGRWCYLCAKFLKWREVTIDHVIPLARGGSHTAANLKVACGPCNFSKQDRLFGQLTLAI